MNSNCKSVKLLNYTSDDSDYVLYGRMACVGVVQLQTECNYYAEVCLPDTIEVSGGEIVFEHSHHEGGFPQCCKCFIGSILIKTSQKKFW